MFFPEVKTALHVPTAMLAGPDCRIEADIDLFADVVLEGVSGRHFLVQHFQFFFGNRVGTCGTGRHGHVGTPASSPDFKQGTKLFLGQFLVFHLSSPEIVSPTTRNC